MNVIQIVDPKWTSQHPIRLFSTHMSIGEMGSFYGETIALGYANGGQNHQHFPLAHLG